ncbi:MAG: hypothetical protein EOP06_27460, partial [Proteobacteria bacterium]
MILKAELLMLSLVLASCSGSKGGKQNAQDASNPTSSATNSAEQGGNSTTQNADGSPGVDAQGNEILIPADQVLKDEGVVKIGATVLSLTDLPICSQAQSGKVYLVNDDMSLYYCKDSTW